jgi:hypothetical protein
MLTALTCGPHPSETATILLSPIIKKGFSHLQFQLNKKEKKKKWYDEPEGLEVKSKRIYFVVLCEMVLGSLFWKLNPLFCVKLERRHHKIVFYVLN